MSAPEMGGFLTTRLESPQPCRGDGAIIFAQACSYAEETAPPLGVYANEGASGLPRPFAQSDQHGQQRGGARDRDGELHEQQP